MAVGRRLIPVDGEDAFQFLVCGGYAAHRTGELLAKIDRCRKNITPAATVRNGKTVLATRPENRLLRFGELLALLALEYRNGLVGLVLPLVAKAFVEHQRQDVILVILAGSLATQDVGGAPQVGFELLLGQSHCCSGVSSDSPIQ